MSIIKYSPYDAPFCLHSENRISLLHNTEHSYTDSARRPLSRLHIYNLLLCPLYKLIKSNIIHVKCVIIFRESYYKDRSITLEIFNLMFFTSMSCLTCEREKRRSTRNIDDGDDEERRKKKYGEDEIHKYLFRIQFSGGGKARLLSTALRCETLNVLQCRGLYHIHIYSVYAVHMWARTMQQAR